MPFLSTCTTVQPVLGSLSPGFKVFAFSLRNKYEAMSAQINTTIRKMISFLFLFIKFTLAQKSLCFGTAH
jgi:hypothetical protein